LRRGEVKGGWEERERKGEEKREEGSVGPQGNDADGDDDNTTTTNNNNVFNTIADRTLQRTIRQ